MRLYDKLNQRKQQGETLDMKHITYETLYQLWWKEECTDGIIAELYGVSKKKVTNLRHKWGVKTPETIINEFQERFTGEIPGLDGDVESNAASADVILLLRKINDLNDIELETLRIELARRFSAFSEVKQEVDFLRAVESAVRNFRPRER